ncbi:hemerythrin [Colwellia psychrerythraea]|uniref:Hemerythrin n=1 Tax=Colwellia psychrerythraea TaxID=28229 RepID=A0A1Y5EIG0_COLPS|nr:hemerythrin [Colwellia psychrerythraea]
MIINNRAKSASFIIISILILLSVILSFLTNPVSPTPWVLIIALCMMPLIKQKHIKQIKWSKEYSIGIEYIDQDHKKLLHLLNQFSIAYDYAQCEEFEREALEELVSYTKYHFKREEKLMEDYGYPGFPEHQEEHQAMIDKVEEYVAIYNIEGHDSLKQVTNLLTYWLINHIQESDTKYRDYLVELGADEFDV